MSEAKENFEKWFVAPLLTLNKDGDAGFAVLMIAFPLLERYLREKSGVSEGDLNDRFYDEFHNIFNNLNRDLVRKLWHSYRNGLVHQATFSKMKSNGTVMPSSFITSNVDLIDYDNTNDAFYVNPRAFSETIIEVIKGDFRVFEGASSLSHPLSEIVPNSSASDINHGPSPSGVM